jgi:hypothetical protein
VDRNGGWTRWPGSRRSTFNMAALDVATHLSQNNSGNVTYHTTNATLGEGRVFFSWFGSSKSGVLFTVDLPSNVRNP